MEILVFHPDVSRLHLISLCLESQFNVNIKAANDFGQAVKYLIDHSDIDLIIIGETDELPALMKYLLSVGSKIPVIVAGVRANSKEVPEIPELKILAQIKDVDLQAELPGVIENHYQQLVAESAAKAQPYCRINVELLCDVTPLTGDVFVQLSSIKYVRVFKAGTVFTEKDLDRFLGIKKIDYLFIQKSDAGEFISRLQGRLTGLETAAAEGDENILSTVGQVHETVQDLSKRIGFTEPVMELARTQVKLTLKVIGRSPRLSRIFEGSLLQNVNYTSRHSLMLAHVSCAIANKMGWHSDSTFQKLIIAAFLHDIALSKPEYAQINTKAALQEAKEYLSQTDYKAVETHPFAAAQLVDKFLEIPGDIYLVVLQHHERPDGSGFPTGLRGNMISPLSAVFITAHDMVDAYFDEGESFNLEKFWDDRKDIYSMGTFKKIAKLFADSKTSAA